MDVVCTQSIDVVGLAQAHEVKLCATSMAFLWGDLIEIDAILQHGLN